MYVCIHVCAYVRVYVYVCVRVCACVFWIVWLHSNTYTQIYLYLYTCVNICMHESCRTYDGPIANHGVRVCACWCVVCHKHTIVRIWTWLIAPVDAWHVFMYQYAYYGVATISSPLKWYVSFAKQPYKRDNMLQKRRIIWRSLLIVATP